MSDYEKIAQAIIQQQERIIGPLAWNEADKVPGLDVDQGNVKIHSEGTKVLADLVRQYEMLFGQASVEACKDAIRPIVSHINSVKLPESLT